jgi:tetratricopeptide (TPR) repeat protein
MVDATSVRLITEALALLSREDSALRACLIAYLARTSEKLQSLDELLAMLNDAISMARRLEDPHTLIDCARFRFSLDRDPSRIGERLGLADEMVELTQRVDNKSLHMELLMFRTYDSLAVGNLEACERDLDTVERLANKLGDPFYIYHAETMRVSGALLTGRLAEAEELAMNAMSTGQKLGVDNVEGVMGVQMFTIRREQGRLGEIAPLVSHFLEKHGAGASWRPGLALIHFEIGEREKAREQFERMASTNFKCVPRDSLWQTCLSYLTEVCDGLDDSERAQLLYDLLQPYAEHTLVVGNAIACLGATSRYLAQLATVCNRWDDAERHFQHAIELNRRLNARPWLAHTQFQYARMLLKRGPPHDPELANELLDEAAEAAESLNMGGLRGKMRALLSDA